MTTIVITIDIPEDGFISDEELIDFRDNFGDMICRITEAAVSDIQLTASVDHVD